MQNNEVRPSLEDLRKRKLVLDQVGIGFLFQKLLEELSQRDIYVILDGLDEADHTTVDETARVPRPEIEILLNCLSTLPSVRMLFVSRPNFDIAQIIRNFQKDLMVKPIGSENQNDIDTYVEEAMSDKRLQEGFKSAKIDPVPYFKEKGKNIFLWVVLVLFNYGSLDLLMTIDFGLTSQNEGRFLTDLRR